MVATIVPLLAWFVEIFLGLGAFGLQKVAQVLLFVVGSVVLLVLGWNAGGDVDHDKFCVCYTHCL